MIIATHALPYPRLVPPLHVQGVLWGLTAVTIWGIYLAFAKAGVNAGIPPADLAFVRYATAGAILLPWLLRHSPRTLAGVGWGKAAVLTLLAGLLFILVGASGFLFAPLSHGAVVQPVALTIGGLALGALVLRDRLTPNRVIGGAVILAGLALVAGPNAAAGGLRALLGDAMFAMVGAMWAGFAVLQKRWCISPMAAMAVVSVLSAAVYAPLHLGLSGLDALGALPASMLVQQVIVQGVLSGVVAVFAFGRAAQLIGPARAAAFPALVPGVAILAGIPVAGEVPAGIQIIGLLVVTTGLFVTQRRAA